MNTRVKTSLLPAVALLALIGATMSEAKSLNPYTTRCPMISTSFSLEMLQRVRAMDLPTYAPGRGIEEIARNRQSMGRHAHRRDQCLLMKSGQPHDSVRPCASRGSGDPYYEAALAEFAEMSVEEVKAAADAVLAERKALQAEVKAACADD